MRNSEALSAQVHYDMLVRHLQSQLITNNRLDLGSRVRLKQKKIAWDETTAHQYVLRPVQVGNLSVIQECQSFDLPNNDVVKPSNFILYAVGATSSQHSIAKVLEMLHVASGASSCVYFLVQSYVTSDFVMPYRYPSLCAEDPGKFELIEAKVRRCTDIEYLCKVPDT
jgi:hypothetical protein